jgi:DNA-binding transcriptional MerR regulator
VNGWGRDTGFDRTRPGASPWSPAPSVKPGRTLPRLNAKPATCCRITDVVLFIMNAPDSLSIDQLATLGGVTRRTVRFYIQKGLLPGPIGAGRGATYTADHLQRLIRIRDLQAAGIPLSAMEEDLARGSAFRGEEGEIDPLPVPPRPRAVQALVFEIAPGVFFQVHAGALPDRVATDIAARLKDMLTESAILSPPTPSPDHGTACDPPSEAPSPAPAPSEGAGPSEALLPSPAPQD